MNKKSIIVLASVALLAMPLVSLAGPSTFNPGGVPQTLNITLNALIALIFDFIWPIVAAFTIIMFLVAGFQFFTAQGDPGKLDSARQFVIWGAVGMVVVLLAFSIPLIIRNAFPGV